MSGRELLPATQVVMGSHSNCGTSRAVQRVLCGPGQGAAVPGAGEGGYWRVFKGQGWGEPQRPHIQWSQPSLGINTTWGRGLSKLPAPKASDMLIQ